MLIYHPIHNPFCQSHLLNLSCVTTKAFSFKRQMHYRFITRASDLSDLRDLLDNVLGLLDIVPTFTFQLVTFNGLKPDFLLF